jgi:hypothetical protein
MVEIKPYNVLFADAMEAITIQFDRKRSALKVEYAQRLAAIAVEEAEAIDEAKFNVRMARMLDAEASKKDG